MVKNLRLVRDIKVGMPGPAQNWDCLSRTGAINPKGKSAMTTGGILENSRRRGFLARTGALAAAAAVPMLNDNACASDGPLAAQHDHAGAPPKTSPGMLSHHVSLSDFGGYTSAGGAAIIQAFEHAFDHLKRQGGGSLTIPPGTYDLGTHAEGIYLIGVKDLQNVEISGYGATLEMTTAVRATTVFFSFLNPSNVTVRGLSFHDCGTDLSVDWQGAVCLDVLTTRPCSGFRTVDCTADHVVSFFRSLAGGAEKYNLTGCDLHATVKNSYYGINIQYNGTHSRCDIACIAVRRGFIGYGMKDWTITMRCESNNWAKGSNGFISLITFTEDATENCSVRLTAIGSTNPYSALIHFYHQEVGDHQTIRNISANVNLNRATGWATIFLFDHALKTGVTSTTSRTFEHITLTGTLARNYAGKVIANPSVSTGVTNEIKISRYLVQARELARLPKYISTFVPS
jgi:hypothetical protein